ncbi:uncharacterized protein ARMOST_20897 [Armillaria ostoyae]|uniref:Uncharacterized protein n=1 Tax=Armillaria ostoyae TaxID=47428 RepID=A0A284S8K4_ARMOS|nr:uncharacterized protein ARMOST_20897 [Armillaria ostoyae]
MALECDASKTLVYNRKTAECTYLDDVGDTQHYQIHCLPVIFIPRALLVVCARSVTLHTSTSTRISTHSFGWSDNPWASELLELYSLSPFPLTLVSKISSCRRALRCTDFILGKRGTAVWICPPDRPMISRWEEHDGCETLMAAVFSGPLNPIDQVRVWEVCSSTLNNWTAFSYDEDHGRIALVGRSIVV